VAAVGLGATERRRRRLGVLQKPSTAGLTLPLEQEPAASKHLMAIGCANDLNERAGLADVGLRTCCTQDIHVVREHLVLSERVQELLDLFSANHGCSTNVLHTLPVGTNRSAKADVS
jgi:hypothetical protein